MEKQHNDTSNQLPVRKEPCELKWEAPSLVEFKSQDTAYGDCDEAGSVAFACGGGTEIEFG